AQLTLLALLPALISIPIFMRIAAFIMSMEPPTLMAPLMTAFTCVLLFLMALGALVSGTLFRGGATVRLFGMAVVTEEGKEVSRLRAFLRTLITWSPVLLLCPFEGSSGWFGRWGVMGDVLVVMAIASVRAMAKPERSLQDRIAGTAIVRR